MIEAPLGDINPSGNAPKNIHAKLDRRQALVLRRLRIGLEDSGAKLADGTEVSDNAKVIRWLLEQLEKGQQ